MNPKEALKSAFAELAPYSERHAWEFHSNLKHIEFISRYVPQSASILDVGSGMGIMALALTKLGYRADGLDKYIFLPETYISLGSEALEQIRAVWKKNNIRIFDFDISDYQAGTPYDCVMNIAVIEHQKDPKRFIASCLKQLRANGYFYCVTPNMVDLLNRLRVLFGRSAFRELKRFFSLGDSFVGHWREYTLSELLQMLSWSGLEIIAAKNYRTSAFFNRRDSFKRSLFLSFFKLLAECIPGARDTNSVIAKKVSSHQNA